MVKGLIRSVPGLTDLQLAILELICSYTKKPSPGEIARKLNIDVYAVTLTLKDPKFKAAYQNVVLSVSAISFKGVMEKIVEQALQGKGPQQKLYLQVHGHLDGEKNGSDKSFPVENNVKELIKRKNEIEGRLINVINKENGSEGMVVQGVDFETDHNEKHYFTDQDEVEGVDGEAY